MIEELKLRSANTCELCENKENLSSYSLDASEDLDKNIHICGICSSKLEDKNFDDHFRCLSGSMWSEHMPVQILSYRILSRMQQTPWANDLFSQMYLEDDAIELAKLDETLSSDSFDSNGAKLEEGDNVTLIKDLVVKGANFTAKRGTLVKGIRMSDNPLHVEGKVNGTKIVLVSAYLKKV